MDEFPPDVELVSALLGAGSMMRADPSHAREALLKLQKQAADAGPEVFWAWGVELLVTGMLTVLESHEARK